MRLTVIDHYPDYGVTKTGRIYSHKSGHWVELKPQMDTDGYLQVRLCNDGDARRSRLVFVHRIVAETFLYKPPGCTEVNHVDGDKLNNNIRNLQWCNRSANMLHAHDSGLIRTRTPIKATNIRTGRSTTFKGQHDAARCLGINQGNINHALKRDGSCYGYKFEYVGEGDLNEWRY